MRDTATTVSAIAERRDDLAGLVTNTNTAFRAIGDQNVALERTLELLPDTLRKANTTFVNLRSTLDDLDRLVAVSKPATRELAPFLRELRPVVREARPTVADLSTLIRSPGENNDLIDLTAKQPRLAELTSSVFPRAIRTLDRAQPVFEYVRSYTPDFASWISNFGQLAANYDANGHYARVAADVPALHLERRLEHAQRPRRPAGAEAGRLRAGRGQPLSRRHRAALPRRLGPPRGRWL